MRREYIFIRYLTWFFFILHFESLYVNAEESGEEYSKGCAHLRCENGSRCIKRRFWCKNPPCPGMLYCSRSRKESLKGPLTCDTVRCNRGHVCIVKVKSCHWDRECKQQIARCVSEKEYYDGAASCAGFECPSGKRCILRETYCVDPPCKLIRSCIKAADVQTWFDECRNLNCTSEYECFLRRPENNCLDPRCSHTSDCMHTVEDELISKYCRGWICPRSQKCLVRIVGFCKGFNCNIERSCRAFMISSAQHDTNTNDKQPPRKVLLQMESEHQELEKRLNLQTNYSPAKEKPTLTTSMQRSSLCHTTPTTHVTEISLTHRPTATTKSNLMTKSFQSSTNQPDFTLPYPQSWWNYNKLSINYTTDIEMTSKLADLSDNATFPASLLVEQIESTTLRDAKRLEMPKKIFIASNDALQLPMVLGGINFVGQNYPIWIKNDPYRAVSLKMKDTWGHHAPQEPYRILLPPYEPVILVEDMRERGQLFPFFTYAFDHPFNEAALTSSPEIASTETTVTLKNNITIVDNKIGNYINDSAIVKVENFKTNYFDNSSNHHTNFSVMKKTHTISPNIHEGLDNYYDDYEWRLWFMNRDYLEQNQSQKQEFISSIVDSMDNLCKNDPDNLTSCRI